MFPGCRRDTAFGVSNVTHLEILICKLILPKVCLNLVMMKTLVSSSLVGSGLEVDEVLASADIDTSAALKCRAINLLSEK